MIQRPPRSTRPDTLFPYTTLCLSSESGGRAQNLDLQFHCLWRECGLLDRLPDTAAHRVMALGADCFSQTKTALNSFIKLYGWFVEVSPISLDKRENCFRLRFERGHPPLQGKPHNCGFLIGLYPRHEESSAVKG